MKCTIQRDQLVAAISKIQGVVPNKALIPILSAVLVEAKDGQLVLTATDLTVNMRSSVDATVEAEGAVTLPARRFFQLMRELTVPTVQLQVSDSGIVIITAGASRFRLHGMDQEEFPPFPDLGQGVSCSMAAKNLRDMLQKTAFAAAKDDARRVLNGIFFTLSKEQVTCVGTDGKRLAKITYPHSINTNETIESIIPLKAVEELIGLLDLDEEITLTFTEDKVGIEVGSVHLVSKLLSGQFPDVERVIPNREEMQKIVIHKEELITLLKQVSLFTTDLTQSVKFMFDQGQLSLQATHNKIGEGQVQMSVDYQAEPLEIAFNPHNFLDVLKHCPEDTVQFGMIDAFNPGSITDSQERTHFVIMPMRLHAEVCA